MTESVVVQETLSEEGHIVWSPVTCWNDTTHRVILDSRKSSRV